MTVSFKNDPKIIHCDGCGVEDAVFLDEKGWAVAGLVNARKDRWYCHLKRSYFNHIGSDSTSTSERSGYSSNKITQTISFYF